ncbi:polyketide cyclase [Glutamicibacter arilaitensis]|uniref:polyketide cyclase n=1 Tax=Glutamicibacter arilaitensis TaxID=256701 RepID=UPI00385173C5
MAMNVLPTGARTPDGALELRREFTVCAAELWTYLAASDRTALWFGRWEGDPGSGEVEVLLSAEEGTPREKVEILSCDRAAYRLAVRTGEGADVWQLELSIEEAENGSRLVFKMPELDPNMAGSVGPGWEYYLDRLVAAVSGANADDVRFEPDYYPALSGYYEALFPSQSG